MQRNLKSLLRLADLKEEEIVLYMHLQRIGEGTVTQLKAETSISLSTIYRTINRLLDRRLIKSIETNAKQSVFVPLPLTSLIKKIKSEQTKLDKLVNSLEGMDNFIPFSESVEIRSGTEAMKEEYLNYVNNARENLFSLGSVMSLWNMTDISYHSSEERNFIKKRLVKGIYARVFSDDDKEFYEVRNNDSLEKRTTKIKGGVLEDKNLFMMTEDYSTFFLCEEENPRVVITRHPDLLRLQKEHFSNLWKSYNFQ
jgi:sugar-specific transcriptional regulator TrmB